MEAVVPKPQPPPPRSEYVYQDGEYIAMNSDPHSNGCWELRRRTIEAMRGFSGAVAFSGTYNRLVSPVHGLKVAITAFISFPQSYMNTCLSAHYQRSVDPFSDSYHVKVRI